MDLRGTGVLLLVAGLLGAFVYFYEIRGEPAREQASETERRVFAGLRADDVDELTIASPEALALRVARREGGWRVLEPVDFPGAASVLDELARSLAEMPSEGRIESPAAEAVYGLDGNALELHFRADGAAYSLRIGNETPIGSNVYVAARGPGETPVAIHMVAGSRVRGFDGAADELRDGRVLVFEPSQVDRIALRWREAPGRSAPTPWIVLERASSPWRIVEPEELDADVGAVNELLQALGRVTATGYLDDPPGEAEAGLDRAEYQVKMRSRGAERSTELQLLAGDLLPAGPAEPARRYVRGDQPSLYLVPAARIAALPRSLFELRFKQVAELSRDAVHQIELVFRTAPGGPEVLRLQRDTGGPAWSLAGDPAETSRVEELVDALADLEAIAVAAEALGPAEREALGLDPALVEVRVRGEATGGGVAPVLAELALGELGRGGLLAQAGGRSEIYRLDASIAEVLPLAADSFRARFTASGASDEPTESVASDGSLPVDQDENDSR